jgi:hypothetical protein
MEDEPWRHSNLSAKTNALLYIVPLSNPGMGNAFVERQLMSESCWAGWNPSLITLDFIHIESGYTSTDAINGTLLIMDVVLQKCALIVTVGSQRPGNGRIIARNISKIRMGYFDVIL